MSDLFHEPNAATLLAPAEREGLRQSWITHRRDLNEAEQENIAKGAAWGRRRRGTSAADLLENRFVQQLHKRMLGEVWKWAGNYRKTERNLGIKAYRIDVEVRALLDDVRYWLEHETYSPDEIAVRLHHRLVAIHPFANGNGRHSRLMADLLVEKLGRPTFTWGGACLVNQGELRTRYIAALKAADNHDVGPLLAFARS
jgi:Fic-DOC domain mobile mystery protein B